MTHDTNDPFDQGPLDRASELGDVVQELRAQLAWRVTAGQAIAVRTEDHDSGVGSPRKEAPEACAPPPDGSSAVLAQDHDLEHIRHELGDCRRCKLHSGRRNIVFGVGDPRSDLVFVGEGPGANEDAEGEPFVGAAGQLLDRMIAAMGYQREEVYICNVIKCRPPGNRDPEPDEVATCQTFLKKQLAAISPKVIVGLGRFAVQCLLGDSAATLARVRGKWSRYEGIDLMPTFHPAYLLRDPAQKGVVWQDLKAVMARLGREVK